jgi:hypothetical protein
VSNANKKWKIFSPLQFETVQHGATRLEYGNTIHCCMLEFSIDGILSVSVILKYMLENNNNKKD